MTTVLLALDESDSAYLAALTATHLFGSDATYLAVHVEPAPTGASQFWGPVYGYGYPSIAPAELRDPASRRDAIEQARLIAARHTRALGVDAIPIGEVGDPVQAISRIAEIHQVDVVAVGQSRRGWFSRLIDVPVTDDLLRTVRVPVLVVPTPDDDAPDAPEDGAEGDPAAGDAR